ncbi:MAG: dihydroorotate dehydrogenase, partial [Spirochaetota bacterium]
MAETKSRHEILRFFKSEGIKLGTVSGVLTTKPSLIEWVDKAVPIDLITTKSYQVNPNPGHREPIIVEPEVGCYGNAVGLRNPGMEKGFYDLWDLRSRYALRSILNVSISAASIDDFLLLIQKFESVADILELNFSCPHAAAGYGASIGSDPALVRDYVKELRSSTEAVLFVKLTPNVEKIGSMAEAAVNSGADGISAINTLGPEIFREPHTGEPVLYNPDNHKGGKSGRWITTIALGKIREIRRAVGDSIPIIGMGGITSGSDVRLMMEAGADVIGIGSVLARLQTEEIPAFIAALKDDCLKGTDRAS